MEAKTHTNNTDTLLIGILGLIFILNALKPWIDYWTPIHYQLITLFQFLLLTFFITFLNKNFYNKIGLLAAFLLLFGLARLIAQTLIDLMAVNILGIVSSLYVVLRMFLLVYLFQIFLNYQRADNVYTSTKALLLSYFLVTFLYSLMQHPLIFDSALMREEGGNLISGNYWGFFRTNGGIGGTVIDYANFLLAVSWVLFFTPFKNSKVKFILLIILASSSILCFTRALFLAWFVILFIYVISFKNVPRILISAVLLIGLPISLLVLNFESLVSFYQSGFGDSDLYRVQQWKLLYDDFSPLEYIVGRELGGNTGLFLGETYKISGDGFITGSLYDSGLLIVFLLIGFIANTVFSIRCNVRIKLSIICSLLVMMIANSGFEKLFMVMTYVISISIIYGRFRYQEQLAKAKKIISK